VATAVDLVALHKTAMMRVVPPEHEQALGLDASVVPTSGQHTYGLARVWNGTQSRTETGRARSALGWLAVTDTGADGLRVDQTPPTGPAADQETTRSDLSRDHVTRVVQPQALSPRRDVVTAGDDRNQKCRDGIRALARHPMGTWRREAHLRSRDEGPPRSGPGRPQPSDGPVQGSARSRVERVASGDEGMVLDTQVVNPGPCKRHVRVGLVVETCTNRSALLVSTDLELAAARLDGSDKARFQMACRCREAKQYAGLSDCQARAHAQLAVHVKLRLMAVTWAKLEARQDATDPLTAFSLASLKRRYVHQHRMARMLPTGAEGTTREQSSPADESLCQDGTITALVA
jgi:hypothetical protein